MSPFRHSSRPWISYRLVDFSSHILSALGSHVFVAFARSCSPRMLWFSQVLFVSKALVALVRFRGCFVLVALVCSRGARFSWVSSILVGLARSGGSCHLHRSRRTTLPCFRTSRLERCRDPRMWRSRWSHAFSQFSHPLARTRRFRTLDLHAHFCRSPLEVPASTRKPTAK
jgi:hypothetical protein